ncbi:hypothetical protein DW657_16395 [Prevotella sp. AM23-5]|uniref:hypothetical protein n=1 Tax=Prevotellaceae TaxID=171552 RepID=UPI000E505A8B|nr:MULTISPECIES: hypothetical protein [Prevotellaceae]RHN85890.1 hypothetical protein DW657_16395 [Prevotella sp. AM23-5]
MKTLKEVIAEANNYSPDNEAMRDAFVNGARFMATGKYYKEKSMFPKVDEFETVDLHETLPPLASVITPTFQDFWDAYAYKKGRKKAEEKWNKLKPKEKVACMRAVPAYVENTMIPGSVSDGSRKQYRMHPLTYLNGARWEDEIYPVQSNEQQRANNLAAKAARILGADYQG